MMEIRRKETIKLWIAIFIILIITGIVVSIVIRYQVTGETSMPFELSKITIISTAEGKQREENPENMKWNIDVSQHNDIYFFFTKNENIKNTHMINSVTIGNIKVTKEPAKGNIKLYMPNSGEGRRFVCDDNFLIEDSLTYKGDTESSEKTLSIANQGGTAIIRVSNSNVGEYISNDDAEIIHDGTLIKLTNTQKEDIQFSISFDIIIVIDQIKYKANMNLDLPYGDILEEGITKLDILDFKDIIFKRT